MKNILSTVFIALILVSCGGNKNQSIEDLLATNNLEEIRQKKSELDAQQATISDQLKQIEDKIKELDPLEKVPLITTVTTKKQVFKHFLELQGNVKTKQNIVIFPEMAGTLQRVYVKEGQSVTKGQTLAIIDDGGLAQQVAQLQIQADLAKTTYERQKRLWEQKIGSEIQFLQAKSNYEAQQKAVSQLNSQLAKTVVKAPFSGVIDDVITEQGNVVAPGQSQLMRIVNLKDMYIETNVPEAYITNVVNGKKVNVEFPVLGTSIDTKIRQTGNFINPANRTFKIEVAVSNDNGNIKPNLTAKLKINDYTNENAILIPQSIISENAQGEQYVYSIIDKDGDKAIAKRAIIKTGKTQGDLIEVLEGINDGDEIIVEGARSVKDNQAVRVLNY